MRERRWPTLADAQRQAWVRGIIGWSLGVLSVIFLLLCLLKDLYHTPAGLFFPAIGPALRRHIDPILDDWAVLSWLWDLIPIWQLPSATASTSAWNFMYILWGVLVVIGVCGLFVRSSRARWRQVRIAREEAEREAWREQIRAAQGRAPDARGARTVITQGVWHQYMAPPESWSQTIWGILILGLVVAGVSGLLLLYVEYAYFQSRWPSSRN
jgi:hypothetical protein